MITTILLNVAISLFVYLIIAFFLIVSPKPKPNKNKISFDELKIDYSKIPRMDVYKSRDSTKLQYRYYASQSDRVVILLHGSGWHSQYFLTLAKSISEFAHVYTPDLRGHGTCPKKRGDIDYIDQLEDDLSDFLNIIKQKHKDSKIILAGHSSGGGLAVRFAGCKYGDMIDAYLLLSPFLKYNAPTIRPNSGGWTNPHTKRIIGLILLNNLGIRCFNYLPVISFNMPKEVRDGTESLSYTYRMNTGYSPRNYKKDLAKINQPLLVLAGTKDESFIAEKFKPVISEFTSAEVEIIKGVTHMGIVVDPKVRSTIMKWLKGI